MRRIAQTLRVGMAGALLVVVLSVVADAQSSSTQRTAPAPAPTLDAGRGGHPSNPKATATPPTSTSGAADDAEKAAKLEQILEQWEKKSATVKSLDARFLRQDVNSVLGDVEFYEGRALLQSPNLACLDTKKLSIDKELFGKAVQWQRNADSDPKADPIPKDKRKFFDRVICTGEAIYHYDGAVQQIFEYPLSRAEQLAALQQGPLPFLFEMKRDEVRKRYRLSLVKETEPNFVIQVVPREPMDRDAFEQAVIYLNKATFLPDLLMLIEPNRNRQIFYLGQIRTNPNLPATLFQHRPADWKNWPLVKNPPLGESPPAGAAPPAKAATKDQPAAKPATRR